MASFTFTDRVLAPIEITFDVLSDHRGYARITPLRSVTLEREGDPAPNGLGAIRVLKAIGPPIREQVTTFDAPTRLSYRLLSGAPLRDHVGTVELGEEGDATRIVYRVDTTPTIPIVGGLVVLAARRSVKQLFTAIVQEAERRARAS